MDYENGHKNIFGLSIVLESKVKNSPILVVKAIFSLKNIKNGDQLLSLTFLDNFDL